MVHRAGQQEENLFWRACDEEPLYQLFTLLVCQGLQVQEKQQKQGDLSCAVFHLQCDFQTLSICTLKVWISTSWTLGLTSDLWPAPAKLATRWPKTPNLVCSTLCSWRTKCPTAASQPEICKTTLTSWLSARKPKAGRAAIQEKATQIHRTARTEDQIDSVASSNTCCMSPSASSAELPPRKLNGRYADGNCRIADDCECTPSLAITALSLQVSGHHFQLQTLYLTCLRKRNLDFRLCLITRGGQGCSSLSLLRWVTPFMWAQ